MKIAENRLSFTLYLAAFSILSWDAVSADQPLPQLERKIVPEVSIHVLRPASGAKIGQIEYTLGNATPDKALEDAILKQLKGYDNCEEDFGTGSRYFYNAVDLNDDGAAETIVYLVGSYVCGSGGCTTLIFQSNGKTHELISRVILVHNPIVVSDQTTNGWRNLILYVAGGGAEAAYHVLKHSGGTYPENPSLVPVLEAGTVVTGDAYIANEILFDTPAPVLRSEGCVAAGFDLLRSEGFGDLRIDLDGEQVVELLGEPETEGQSVMWEGDALHHQTWRYREQGIILDMVSESADGAQKIASIQVGPASKLKTRRGIGIGDSYSDVEKAYGPDKDKESSDPPFTFVGGSLYGGLVFLFERDKVIKILLGSVAE